MSTLAPYEFIERLKSLPIVECLYMYGSRARGEHRSRSDIDLAVWCPRADDRDWQQILLIVEDADTLLPIDIIRLDTLPEGPLKTNIETDKKLLYRRDDCRGNQ